jgi:hypothetical protein
MPSSGPKGLELDRREDPQERKGEDREAKPALEIGDAERRLGGVIGARYARDLQHRREVSEESSNPEKSQPLLLKLDRPLIGRRRVLWGESRSRVRRKGMTVRGCRSSCSDMFRSK